MTRNKPLTLVSALFVLVLWRSPCSAQERSMEMRFEHGFYLEAGERKPAEAIKVYEAVVEGKNVKPGLKARAYVRIGICYSLLGKTEEAKKALEVVIRDFSDQKELASQARDILEELSEADFSTPRKTWATFVRGVTQRRPELVEKCFSKAIAAEQDSHLEELLAKIARGGRWTESIKEITLRGPGGIKMDGRREWANVTLQYPGGRGFCIMTREGGKWLMSSISMALLSTFDIAATGPEKAEEARAPRLIHATRTCTIESARQIDVYPKASGVVAKVFVEEGDTVKKGDALAKLDDQEAALTLKQAELKYTQAKFEFESTKKNFQVGHTTQLQLAAAETQSRTSEIELEKARLAVERMTVTAPMPGVIVERQIHEGATANVGQKLFTIADLHRLIVKMHVAQESLRFVKVGQKALITSKSYPGANFGGKVTAVSPIMEGATATVVVSVEDPQGLLKLGMEVSACLEATADAANLSSPSATFDALVKAFKSADLDAVPALLHGELREQFLEEIEKVKSGNRSAREAGLKELREKFRRLNPIVTSKRKIDKNHFEIEYALSGDVTNRRKMRMVKVGNDWRVEKWESTRVDGMASPVYRAKARLIAAGEWKPGVATPSTDLGELVKAMRAKLADDDFQNAVRKALDPKADLPHAIFDRVKIKAVNRTRLVDIQVSSSHAELSANLANAIAERLAADYEKQSGARLTIIERASPPRLPHRGAIFQP